MEVLFFGETFFLTSGSTFHVVVRNNQLIRNNLVRLCTVNVRPRGSVSMRQIYKDTGGILPVGFNGLINGQ